MVFNYSWSSYDLGNNNSLSFTAKHVEAWLRSDFGPQYRFMMIPISFQGDFCIFQGELYQMFCSSLMVLIAGRWKNFSFSSYIYEDFSMGQRSPTDLSSRDFFSSIYASFLLFVRVPISSKFWRIVIPISSVFFML